MNMNEEKSCESDQHFSTILGRRVESSSNNEGDFRVESYAATPIWRATRDGDIWRTLRGRMVARERGSTTALLVKIYTHTEEWKEKGGGLFRSTLGHSWPTQNVRAVRALLTSEPAELR